MEDKNKLKNEINRFDAAFKVTPLRNALEVIGIYVVVGVLWIFFSDTALSLFVRDQNQFENLQLIKGLSYVAITGYIFYLIIKKRMESYYTIMSQLNTTMIELQNSNIALHELEQELEQLAYYDSLTGLYTRNKVIKCKGRL